MITSKPRLLHNLGSGAQLRIWTLLWLSQSKLWFIQNTYCSMNDEWIVDTRHYCSLLGLVYLLVTMLTITTSTWVCLVIYAVIREQQTQCSGYLYDHSHDDAMAWLKHSTYDLISREDLLESFLDTCAVSSTLVSDMLQLISKFLGQSMFHAQHNSVWLEQYQGGFIQILCSVLHTATSYESNYTRQYSLLMDNDELCRLLPSSPDSSVSAFGIYKLIYIFSFQINIIFDRQNKKVSLNTFMELKL